MEETGGWTNGKRISLDENGCIFIHYPSCYISINPPVKKDDAVSTRVYIKGSQDNKGIESHVRY